MLAVTLVLLLTASETLEAEGRAPASLGATRAKAAARDDALRNMVLAACDRLAAADPNVKACATAGDSALAEFKGLVTNAQVISEETTGGVVKVKLRADLSLDAVSSRELESQRLLAKLPGKKLGVGVVEEHFDELGAAEGNATVLSTRVGELFRAAGFKLFPVESFKVKDVDAAIAAGKKEGLDFMLIGEVKTADQPKAPDDEARNKRGNLVRVRWRVELAGRMQLIDVATGLPVSTVPVDANIATFPARCDRSYPDTRMALVEARAPSVHRALIAELLKVLRDREVSGAQITVTIAGVKDDAQASALVDGVKALPNVRGVTTQPVAGGVATLTVLTGSTAKELAKALGKAKGFSVTGVKGDAVTVTLGK